MSLLGRLASVTPLHRRELFLLCTLPPVLLVTGLEVVRLVGEAVTKRPKGLPYHLLYAPGAVLGLDPGVTRAVAGGFLLGLFLLTALDEYKRVHGVLLLILSGVGLVVLNGVDVLLVDWTRQVGPLVVGVLLGATVGGLRRGGSLGVTHDVFRDGPETSLREFPRALYRVFAVVGLVAVVALVESAVIYDSPLVARPDGITMQAFELRGVVWRGFLYDAGVVVGFLASIWTFRSNTADTEVVLLGPTGAGKTSTLAGLAASAPAYAGGTADVNEPLAKLRDGLESDGTFPSTRRDRLYPLSLSYRHGRLFPRKVTIRTLDYAGDHLADFEPRRSADETLTDDATTVFEVARYLYHRAAVADGGAGEFAEWATGESAETTDDEPQPDTEETDAAPLRGGDEPVGRDPGTVSGLAETSGSERVAELVADAVYHADVVGLVYPMDDFAQPAVESGTVPPYARVVDGELENPRVRESYTETLASVVETAADTTDLFAVATKADYVREYAAIESGVNPDRDWRAFGRVIARDCVGDAMPAVLHDDTVPVYLPVTDDEPPGRRKELSVDLDTESDRLPLHGAESLLDRTGRWRLTDLLRGDGP
ncbi:hypothetical protein RYH80_15225 [Halobaculum sp. MBLA0147]|uniref:hypothetical protein n=1 Tax=Halobaculum sp. MBLA0147 TaxID=3079934 RepID=UPI003523E34C